MQTVLIIIIGLVHDNYYLFRFYYIFNNDDVTTYLLARVDNIIFLLQQVIFLVLYKIYAM